MVSMTCFERMNHIDDAPITFAVVNYGGWGARPKGIVLYNDGVLCSYERDQFPEKEDAEESITPVGFAPRMVEDILGLILANEKKISCFPEELHGDAFDMGFTEINFNGKCCYAYALSCCPEGKEIIFWKDAILCCIKRYGYYNYVKDLFG